MKKLLYLLILLFPWRIRRALLCRVWGYQLHPTSRIGLSWIMPGKLTMGANSQIGHFTICKGLERLSLGESAFIGNGNWITGYPKGLSASTGHFAHLTDREPVLIVEEHAAITHRHIIDCTHRVRLGRFSTMAGYASQILTHSIDLEACRQSAAPVDIGAYCFVGTNVVLLGGSILPDYCVLGAKSLLNKAYRETHTLYGGVPARSLRAIPDNTGYFQRTTGFIV